MAVDVGETVVIERPIDEVAGFAGDPSNTPEWSRRISSAEWRTDPPISLGSIVVIRGGVAGREIVYAFDVTEYTAGRHVEIKASAGPLPTTAMASWRPVGDRVTHMTLRVHVEPTGFSRLATPLIRRAVRRAVRRDLTDLKRLLERA